MTPPHRSRLMGLLLAFVSACSGTSGVYLPRDSMLDPETCRGCHPTQFDQWQGSMHAYASDDPVFLAMNARGQRETDGGLGTFCVQCHAPLAFREGVTTDGLNLPSVDAGLHGVTCFFCHAVDQVNGSHDAPLHLAGDLVMRGEIRDAVPNTGHRTAYSALLDRDQSDSAAFCGACHDIVNGHGAAIERTFSEWQQSVFSQPSVGTTCGQCHMPQTLSLGPIATYPNAPASRRLHDHSIPGVDVALTPFPNAQTQALEVQEILDSTLQSAVCVESDGSKVHVILDNVAAGHTWPSGAAQDRRAWVEVVAYQQGQVTYQSGVVPVGGSITNLQDPDLWLMRDCMRDASNNPVNMFWQAASAQGNELPFPVTFNQADPRFYRTHIIQTYPSGSVLLSGMPDRVTARVRIQPIGLDVLQDLVDSGDLDAGYLEKMPVFTVGKTDTLEWTPSTANATYANPNTSLPVSCVTQTNLNVRATSVPADAGVCRR